MTIRLYIAAYGFAGLLALAPQPTFADDLKPPTLARALAAAAPPKSELYIALDADQVTLPKDAAPAAAGDTAGQVAATYGQLVVGYGAVEAIAPPTIMVINIPPDKPNPYDGMDPKQIVKLLAATFTTAQWKDFLSEKGVGYADLSGDDQRRLFESLFPDFKMRVVRIDASNDPATDLGADQLRQARLRLAYLTGIALSVPGQPGSHIFANNYQPPSASATYMMMNAPTDSVDREFGAYVREMVPNVLKPSDLGEDEAWKTPVSIAGLRTVEDCARAVSSATGREVYADPRYGARAVTMLGPQDSARSWDLMRALALCLGATWRQVGPALILTNDRVGLGVKHVLWKEFEEKAAALAPGGKSYAPVTQPSDSAETTQDIPFTDDAMPLSAKQQKDYWKKLKERGSGGGSDLIQITLPFAELSPEQQDAARHIQEENARQHISSTLDGDVMLQAEPEIQIVVPALAGPVYMFQSYENLLPGPRSAVENPNTDAGGKSRTKETRAAAPQAPPEDPAGAMRRLMRAFDRRAAIVAARGSDEFAADLTKIRAAGLNEVWLRFPPAAGKDDAAARDLLRRAATLARAAHITLYADFSLLNWGSDAPSDLLDRTLKGETGSAGTNDFGVHVDTVTPFDPETARRAADLIGAAARIPGVDGMVWTDCSAHGYEQEGSRQDSFSSDSLGYALQGRLVSLRRAHVDPLDLHTTHYSDKRANVSVPGFGDDSRNGALYDAWCALRSDAERRFLAALTSALPASYAPGPHRCPILTPPAGDSFVSEYGSWDDFAKPPSDIVYVPAIGADGKPDPEGSMTASLAASTVYAGIRLNVPASATAAEVATDIAASLNMQIKLKMRNVFFDVTAQPDLPRRLADAAK